MLLWCNDKTNLSQKSFKLLIKLLVAFWLYPGLLVLHSNKPLDHWPFQQQATKQPIVSPEVTYGGIEKQVSLFKWLWSLE